MTPPFALDLSPDGVVLLAKPGARWLRVGMADPEGDLDAGMATLRDAAGQPGAPLPVRAVLPRDQLLYMTLDGLPEEGADRFRAIRRALDGRTPYPVEDLAFDWHDLGPDQAAVCAVARETLDEAAAFLEAHGFAAAAFVAAPRPGAEASDAAEASFGSEPFLAPGTVPGGAGRGGAPVRASGDMPPALISALRGRPVAGAAAPADDPADVAAELPEPSNPETAPLAADAPQPVAEASAASPGAGGAPPDGDVGGAGPFPDGRKADEADRADAVAPAAAADAADPLPRAGSEGLDAGEPGKGDLAPVALAFRRSEVPPAASDGSEERAALADASLPIGEGIEAPSQMDGESGSGSTEDALAVPADPAPVHSGDAASLPSPVAGAPREERKSPPPSFASRRMAPSVPRDAVEVDPHRRAEPRITFRPIAERSPAAPDAVRPLACSDASPAKPAPMEDGRRPGAAFRRSDADTGQRAGTGGGAKASPTPSAGRAASFGIRPAPQVASAFGVRQNGPAASDDGIPAGAAPFTRPRSRIDTRAADRLQTMRGETRPLAAPIQKRTPDEIVAAFAGLKDTGAPQGRGTSLSFLGGLAAGLAVVGAVGGWLLFGPGDAAEPTPVADAMRDAPVVAADSAAGSAAGAGTALSGAADRQPLVTASAAGGQTGDEAGAEFARVFRGGEVIPVEPVPEATAVSAAASPALPDPDAAAVRSAPRALAAPSVRSGDLPVAPDALPGEEAALPPEAPSDEAQRTPDVESASAAPAAEPERDPRDGSLAAQTSTSAPDPASELDAPAAITASAQIDDAARGATSGQADLAAADPGATSAGTTDGLEIDDITQVAFRELSARAVQQSAPRRQAEPRAVAAGIVDVAAIPATWDGPRGTGTLAGPVPPLDPVPGIYLPPAPAGPSGVAAARPRATPDGVEGLEGVLIFAGGPPRQPPVRPEAPPTVLGSFPDPALVGYRPRGRSADAAARWLEAERAAAADAERIAAQAADPASATAEPAAAELADEPVAPAPDAGADVIAVAFDGLAASEDASDAAPVAAPEEVARAATDLVGGLPQGGDARAGEETLSLASADLSAPLSARPAIRPGPDASADMADAADPAVSDPQDANPSGTGLADGTVRVEASPAGPGDPRPTARPRLVGGTVSADAIAEAIAAAEDFAVVSASAFAVPASPRPGNRTRDLTRKAAAILERRRAEAVQTVQVRSVPAAAAPTASASAAPNLPTRASVARAATLENALSLRKTALMGTYGSRSSRRALIRTASGRYVKVEVGDRLDGGKVQAIGDGVLVYVKGGRKVTLEVPGS